MMIARVTDTPRLDYLGAAVVGLLVAPGCLLGEWEGSRVGNLGVGPSEGGVVGCLVEGLREGEWDGWAVGNFTGEKVTGASTGRFVGFLVGL